MKVYIVRHGQVPHNALGQYNTIDEDLTQLGINQARELRDKIKNMNFDIIISSPLVRARHTSYIINVNNQKVVYDERIKERSCGDLSGKPLEVTNREEYWNYNTSIQYGSSENIKSFFERVYNFLDELKTKNYGSVLIVAHSGVSKAFSGYFDGIQDGEFLNRGLMNCEIKEYKL
ncbi:MAG: histidine phosphatase family protein [Bacilli bacterium]|nr:histidine phosphatase family protein [Bacilli bacterium]MBP3635530.1 histidine phosphatase family protein [Bacilli bacterium]